MIKTLPTVSVVMANYNHAKYLPEALEAFLSQTYPAHEVIVVDDASTDESCAIVEEFQKKHPNLLLMRREKNSGGPMVPFWDGLNRATGTYMTFSASDDRVEPWFLEEALKFVSDHPEVAICCGDLSIFSDGPRPYQFRRERYLRIESPRIFTPDELSSTCLKTTFQIATQASIYKVEIARELGAHDPELKGFSDYYLNYQMGFRYPIAYVPRPWATYREIKSSFGLNVSWKERYRLCRKFLKKWESEPEMSKKRWRKSGILRHVGTAMTPCLVAHPKYWSFIPFHYPKWLRRHAYDWARACLIRFGILEWVRACLTRLKIFESLIRKKD